MTSTVSGKDFSITTNDLFRTRYDNECLWVHRFMSWIMVGQFALGLAFAIYLSPRTWIGERQQIHTHVWAAIVIGSALSSFAILWMRFYPRSTHTRHVVAVVQTLWSALLIHLSGGRIETHFHVFASLAILSIYRDWTILVSATFVVALDHFVRGVFYPLSVFGIVTESPYRWIEHALWVLFEVAFLAPGCYRLRNELWELCVRQTEIEEAKQTVDLQVAQRTMELSRAYDLLAISTAETEKLALVARYTDNAVIITDAEARIEWVNEGFTRMTGYRPSEVIGRRPSEFLHGPKTDLIARQRMREAIQRHAGFNVQAVNYRKNGEPYWVDIEVRPIQNADETIHRFIAIEADITERIRQEEERMRLHQELLDVSRKAGMAEIATGVLHNVGNILNSLNVSVSVIRKQFAKSAFAKLESVCNMLADHEETFADFVREDQRGRKIPAYLQLVTNAIGQERETVESEFDDLLRNVEHINQIVMAQQSMASSKRLIQKLDVAELIADALNANKAALIGNCICVETRIDPSASTIQSEKHRILQILINLIKNAKEAHQGHGTTKPSVVIEATIQDDLLVISVEDNGPGIAPDKLSQIFQHGFTTKDDGHGFGLHSSANAAGELGGTLTAYSGGPNCGARFELRVPTQQNSTHEQLAISHKS